MLKIQELSGCKIIHRALQTFGTGIRIGPTGTQSYLHRFPLAHCLFYYNSDETLKHTLIVCTTGFL